MAEHEEKYVGLLERAWAAAILKPRAIGRKGAASGGSKRKKRWTEQPRVGEDDRQPNYCVVVFVD